MRTDKIWLIISILAFVIAIVLLRGFFLIAPFYAEASNSGSQQLTLITASVSLIVGIFSFRQYKR